MAHPHYWACMPPQVITAAPCMQSRLPPALTLSCLALPGLSPGNHGAHLCLSLLGQWTGEDLSTWTLCATRRGPQSLCVPAAPATSQPEMIRAAGIGVWAAAIQEDFLGEVVPRGPGQVGSGNDSPSTAPPPPKPGAELGGLRRGRGGREGRAELIRGGDEARGVAGVGEPLTRENILSRRLRSLFQGQRPLRY